MIRENEHVGLVGLTGSGKTTLTRLITGLEQPDQGRILLDGVPLQDYSWLLQAQTVAIVDQRITLFSDTIRNNITLWDDHVPQETVEQAARIACLHDFITALPGGYAHHLGEDGSNLSGGQRQLLEIARALVHQPALLVLDEATSALDEATEARLLANLSQVGCALLMISHRLDSLRACDYIYVLDGGCIVEHGLHDVLLRNGQMYARLYDAESQLRA
jgi:ABC-type bacteriocin/lantibiotic exporter with double-glycine peptidase domain